uniref:Uncharacterized protein n=1 Tax=Arundo donax TaxID=35708 RepID=A0A0A8Z8H5_ARUDO
MTHQTGMTCQKNLKNIYLRNRKMIIGNSENILFWENSWISDKPLKNLIPIVI